jgi:hypothetical protein
MIRVRRLQRHSEEEGWYDDAYVLEDEVGQLRFCYNLTWDRVGVKYNERLQASGISLDKIETVLELGDSFRWLAMEEVEDDQAEAFLKELDERCAIPQPRSIAEQLNQTLAA